MGSQRSINLDELGYIQRNATRPGALPQLDLLPSLILLDRLMPVLNGYQTLPQLKRKSADQPIAVVMVSANANSDEIKTCTKPEPTHF